MLAQQILPRYNLATDEQQNATEQALISSKRDHLQTRCATSGQDNARKLA
ncbi:hypothetical protein [Nostoc sp.]